MIEQIEMDQQRFGPRELCGRPEDRRYEQRDLQKTCDDLLHVAVTRNQHTKHQCNPAAIKAEYDKPWNSKEQITIDWEPREQINGDVH